MAEYRRVPTGVRCQIPRSVDHEVSLQDSARKSGRARTRPIAPDLPGEGCGDHTGSGIARSYPQVGVLPPTMAPAKVVQYLKGRSSRRLQDEFPELRKRYWGNTYGRGLLLRERGCGRRGHNQEIHREPEMDEEDQGFKITPHRALSRLSAGAFRRLQPQPRLSVELNSTGFSR